LQDRKPLQAIADDLQFDYVIVGAGAAGCVLADRLSEDGQHRVALIEAGKRDSHPLIHIPAGVGALIGHPQLDWGYATVPQSDAARRRIPLPRGRVLGGCTSTNGMVYFRGHPSDYDEWAELGCPGWSHAEVLPYFVKSEDNAAFGGDHHGKGGPVHVSSYHRTNGLTDRFIRAAAERGYRMVSDFNQGDPDGFGVRQAMIRKGRRVSSATAYLKSARGRPNLAILSERLVDRVLFDGKTAIGILAQRGEKCQRILAAKEVILSAGSFGSPAILQRSGIGDHARLHRSGLATLHHLPQVGRNLQDHLVAPVQMVTRSALPYVVDGRVLPRLIANLAEYALLRRGPLASNVFEATGFVRTAHAGPRPDVQLIFMPMHRAPGPLPRKRGYGILAGLLRPKSRGSVHVASPDPREGPAIDPGFLSDPDDLPPLIEGVRIARSILAASAFSDLASTEFLPGSDVSEDTAIAQVIRETCATVHHPVGTCRMGSDPTSVTDPQLRVRDLDRLRVVDASVMPRIIGGNTAAPTFMIAEKASDLIRGRALPTV
jgi:choline dehydrogenase